MPSMDEDPWNVRPLPTAAPTHVLGEPLDAMSIAELDHRIGLLRDEIRRLEEKRTEKDASRTAADAFFKR